MREPPRPVRPQRAPGGHVQADIDALRDIRAASHIHAAEHGGATDGDARASATHVCSSQQDTNRNPNSSADR